MDVGGTMDPYVEPIERLLTALHDERGLRGFEPYYFTSLIEMGSFARIRDFDIAVID